MELLQNILNKLNYIVNESEFLKKIESINVKNLDINKILNQTDKFIDGFGVYLKNPEIQQHILKIIFTSYEICEDLDDLMDIFLKTMIVRLIELYLTYAKINETAKDSVLNILGTSFGRLDPKAQILNVCILVDPIFKSKEYIADKSKLEEEEIVYKEIPSISNIEREIKLEIDNWIKSVYIDLNKQDELIEKLKVHCKNIAKIKQLNINSNEYIALENECIEMLRMQITSIALISELEDENLMPIPIQ